MWVLMIALLGSETPLHRYAHPTLIAIIVGALVESHWGIRTVTVSEHTHLEWRKYKEAEVQMYHVFL